MYHPQGVKVHEKTFKNNTNLFVVNKEIHLPEHVWSILSVSFLILITWYRCSSRVLLDLGSFCHCSTWSFRKNRGVILEVAVVSCGSIFFYPLQGGNIYLVCKWYEVRQSYLSRQLWAKPEIDPLTRCLMHNSFYNQDHRHYPHCYRIKQWNYMQMYGHFEKFWPLKTSAFLSWY